MKTTLQKYLSVVLFLMLGVVSRAQIQINELQASNGTTLADYQGEFPDWIELYNTSSSDVNLEGYGLSDDAGTPFKWFFSAMVIPANGYLVVFASGKDIDAAGELHTNFKLSAAGEKVFLTAPSGILLGKVNAETLTSDQSWGRASEGVSDWLIFTTSTPGASNVGGVSITPLTSKPSISLKAGFYSSTVSVELTCLDAGATALYSLDGNYPSVSYTGVIAIEASSVVKSICVSANDSSKVKTDSYLIGTDHDIPVLSLSFKPDDFFDVDSGIYVLGDDYENAAPNFGANFWESWERKIHMEYFVDGSEKIEQDVGGKIFGGWSRAHDMKSIRLIARKEYGDETIDYPFFKKKPYLDEFDQLVLRNSGNDFNGTMWADAVNHEVLSQMSEVDRMAYQPVAVYFNGEYWGLHNLRERINPEYIGFNHGINSNSVNLLEVNGGIDFDTAAIEPPTPEELLSEIKQGSNETFVAMYDFIIGNDMSLVANYEQAEQMLDVDMFIDYFAAEIYHINWDWPQNNIRFWSSNEKDGKWRYIYYDTEFGQNLYGQNTTAVDYNELDRVINDDRNVHSMMLKKLLENEMFKNKFINRSADFMNTIYLPENYGGIAQQFEDVIANEIEKHLSIYDAWPGPCCRQDRIDEYLSFIEGRPENARAHITSVFGFDQTELILNVSPEGAGIIKVNSVIPDVFPWNGVYYQGVPVEITAIANTGYEFSSFIGDSINTLQEHQWLDLGGSPHEITASFTSTSFLVDLKITEINYNSQNMAMESGDWIELYNNGNVTIDLSGWVFNDESPISDFVFVDGATLAAGEYLVIAQDLASFSAVYPNVNNVIGDFGFSLNNGGETITITDSNEVEKLSVRYNDKAPWPIVADGKGATLELVSVNSDYTVATNWQGECKGGSPGEATQSCSCTYNVDLGEDIISCTNISEVLTSGIATVNRDFYWYENGTLISIQPEYTATLAGKYTLVVNEALCVGGDDVKIIDDLSIDLGKDLHLCEIRNKTLSAGLESSAISYSWIRDTEEISNENAIYVNTAGVYVLNVNADGCPSASDEVIFTTGGPTPVDDTYCEEDGNATLYIVGEGTYTWYASDFEGDLLGEGTALSVDDLVSDTTFYVQDDSYQAAIGGVLEPSMNSLAREADGEGMAFTIHNKLRLKSVSVQSAARWGDITAEIVLYNDLNEVIKEASSNVGPGSLTAVNLDIELEAGDYTMEVVSSGARFGTSDLAYETVDLAFPYLIGDNMLTLTGTINGQTNVYNYLYAWNIEKGEQGCSRVPVNLTIEDCIPTAVSEVERNTADITVMPTVSEGLFTFSKEVGSVIVLSVGGKKVLTGTNVKSLDLSSYPTGMYLLNIVEDGIVTSLKVIKM